MDTEGDSVSDLTAPGEAVAPTETHVAEVKPRSPGKLHTEEYGTSRNQKPRKYHGIDRSAPLPNGTAQNGDAEDGQPPARDRSLQIAVRLRFDRDGFCQISLIAKRPKDLPEEISVVASSGRIQLGAIHDDWYQDIVPGNISQVLRDGTVWTDEGADGQFTWSLSGRELFVLAARSDVSGFVSQPCLDLGRSHVVLCSSRIGSEVQAAVRAAGANSTAVIDESMGAPPGWIVIRDVVPITAVNPLGGSDLLNALRPVPHIEISLEEGIRIRHLNWLEGHPPMIRVYGDPQHTDEVRIDGQLATLGTANNYLVRGCDSVGQHSVWCAGSIKSYTIVPFSASWERWDAFTFPVRYGSPEKISLCGPLVHKANSEGGSSEPSVVVPATNPVLIGSVPGDFAVGHRVSDVRATVLVASPPFRPVWGTSR
jgi:hypothetical protein